MCYLRFLCVLAGAAVTAPALAGSSGLGLPDAGASIRQLNRQAVERFNSSSSDVRRTLREQHQKRKAREQAFTKQQRQRREKRDLEREHHQR